MPFKSQAQRRFMYVRHPEIAKRWQRVTPKGERLPEYVNRGKAASSNSDWKGWISPTNQWHSVAPDEPHAAYISDKHEKYYHPEPHKIEEMAIMDGWVRVTREGDAIWANCIQERAASALQFLKSHAPAWCKAIQLDLIDRHSGRHAGTRSVQMGQGDVGNAEDVTRTYSGNGYQMFMKWLRGAGIPAMRTEQQGVRVDSPMGMNERSAFWLQVGNIARRTGVSQQMQGPNRKSAPISTVHIPSRTRPLTYDRTVDYGSGRVSYQPSKERAETGGLTNIYLPREAALVLRSELRDRGFEVLGTKKMYTPRQFHGGLVYQLKVQGPLKPLQAFLVERGLSKSGTGWIDLRNCGEYRYFMSSERRTSMSATTGVECSQDAKGPSMSATFADPAHARRFAALCATRVPTAKLSLDGQTVKVRHDDGDSAQLFALAARVRKTSDRSALMARRNKAAMGPETYGVQTPIPETLPAPQSPPPTSPAERQTTPQDQLPAQLPRPKLKEDPPKPETPPPPPTKQVVEIHFLRRDTAEEAYDHMRRAGVECRWDGEERVRALSGPDSREAVNGAIAMYKGSPVQRKSRPALKRSVAASFSGAEDVKQLVRSGSLEQLRKWLKRNDPNGEYDDNKLTLREAKRLVLSQYNRGKKRGASMESKIKPWQKPEHPRYRNDGTGQPPGTGPNKPAEPDYPRTPLDDKADQVLLVLAGAATASVILGALHQLGVAAYQSGRNVVAKLTKSGDAQKVAIVEKTPGVVTVKKSRSGKRKPKTQQAASMAIQNNPISVVLRTWWPDKDKFEDFRADSSYTRGHSLVKRDQHGLIVDLDLGAQGRHAQQDTKHPAIVDSPTVVRNVSRNVVDHGGRVLKVFMPSVRNSLSQTASFEETPTQAIVRLVVDFASPYLASKFAELAAKAGWDVAKSSKWSLTMSITSLLKSAAHKLIEKYHGHIQSERQVSAKQATPEEIEKLHLKVKVPPATKMLNKKKFVKTVQLKPDDEATSRRRPGAASMAWSGGEMWFQFPHQNDVLDFVDEAKHAGIETTRPIHNGSWYFAGAIAEGTNTPAKLRAFANSHGGREVIRVPKVGEGQHAPTNQWQRQEKKKRSGMAFAEKTEAQKRAQKKYLQGKAGRAALARAQAKYHGTEKGKASLKRARDKYRGMASSPGGGPNARYVDAMFSDAKSAKSFADWCAGVHGLVVKPNDTAVRVYTTIESPARANHIAKIAKAQGATQVRISSSGMRNSQATEVACVLPAAVVPIAWGVYYTAATIANLAMGVELIKTLRNALPGAKVVKAKGKTVVIKSRDKKTQQRVDQLVRQKGGTAQDVSQAASMAESGKYPWDKCMRDAERRYGSKEQARRVCGAIRARRGGRASMALTPHFPEGRSLVQSFMFTKPELARRFTAHANHLGAKPQVKNVQNQRFFVQITTADKETQAELQRVAEQLDPNNARATASMSDVAQQVIEFAISPVVIASAMVYLQRKGIRCYKTNGDKTLVCRVSERAGDAVKSLISTMDKKFDAVVSKVPGVQLKPAEDWGPTRTEQKVLHGARKAIKHGEGAVDTIKRGIKFVTPQNEKEWALATVVTFGTAAAAIGAYKILKAAGMACKTIGKKVLVALRGPQDQHKLEEVEQKVGEVVSVQPGKVPMSFAMSLLPASMAALPMMITRDMKQQLLDLGFKKSDIVLMKPQQAWDIITKRGGKLPSVPPQRDYTPQPNLRQQVMKSTHPGEQITLLFARDLASRAAATALIAAGVAATAYGTYVVVKHVVPSVWGKIKSIAQKFGGKPEPEAEEKVTAAFSVSAGEANWKRGHAKRVMDMVGTGDYEHVRTFKRPLPTGGSQTHSHLKGIKKDIVDVTHVTNDADDKHWTVKGWTTPPRLKNEKPASMGLTSPITSPVDSAETVVGVAAIGGALLFALAPVAARRAVGQLIQTGVAATREGSGTVKAWLRPENLEQAKRAVQTLKSSGARLVGRRGPNKLPNVWRPAQ